MLRTILSLLGISIGIFTIISVFTAVNTLEKNIRGSVASLGDDVIFIQKWSWEFGPDYAWWDFLKRPQPQYKEMKILENRVQTVSAMCMMVNLSEALLKYRNNSIDNAGVVALSHTSTKVRPIEIREGRYFSEIESNVGENAVLLGYNIALALFDYKNPIGKSIFMDNKKLTVVGVIEKEGDSMVGNSFDDAIAIPLNYARTFVNTHSDQVHSQIMTKALPNISVEEMEDDLRGAMRSIRKLKPLEKDDFSLNKASLLISLLEPMFTMIDMIGWIIGGFSILVGGFGIANIMFVSVKEQTNIIGIQKSLGAKNYFILLQFLSEAITLCIIGGALGLLMVYIGTLISTYWFDFELVLSSQNIFKGLFISVVIGIISGFYPAFTASRLEPVVAMRYK